MAAHRGSPDFRAGYSLAPSEAAPHYNTPIGRGGQPHRWSESRGQSSHTRDGWGEPGRATVSSAPPLGGLLPAQVEGEVMGAQSLNTDSGWGAPSPIRAWTSRPGQGPQSRGAGVALPRLRRSRSPQTGPRTAHCLPRGQCQSADFLPGGQAGDTELGRLPPRTPCALGQEHHCPSRSSH